MHTPTVVLAKPPGHREQLVTFTSVGILVQAIAIVARAVITPDSVVAIVMATSIPSGTFIDICRQSNTKLSAFHGVTHYTSMCVSLKMHA